MTSIGIMYFERPGKHNTEDLLEAAKKRAKELGLRHVVIASNSGDTAARAIEHFSDMDVRFTVVTSHCGFSGEGVNDMSPEAESALVEAGAKVVRASHALSGVERSFTRKLGGGSRAEAVSDALRALFGQGMKVCVEITLMAADNGAIPCSDQEVLVIAGTGEGSDTACVLRPAHANDMFKMEVREIIAIPRAKRGGE